MVWSCLLEDQGILGCKSKDHNIMDYSRHVQGILGLGKSLYGGIQRLDIACRGLEAKELKKAYKIFTKEWILEGESLGQRNKPIREEKKPIHL